jgi:uncharacterized oxidoreductase
MRLIGPGPLTEIVERIFAAGGCGAEEAGRIARHLVASNLCGHDSHGVVRTKRYIDFLRAGTVFPGRSADLVFDGGSLLVVDGQFGFGQTIGEQATDLLAERAKAHGIALITIRRSGHLGRLGDWAERLAGHGLVSLHFLNTTGLGLMVTPFGGSDRRLSPSPMAVCVPVEGRDPILLDITTAMTAEGKLLVAKNKGEAVGPGIIVDKAGQPTTDPADFYSGGAILPFGGHRGAGLNILTDILSGALSGGGCTAPGVTVLENTMTSIAIDVNRLPDRAAYTAEILRFCDWVKASPPVDPAAPVLLPGEVEAATRRRRAAEGIPIDDATWGDIRAAAASVSLPEAEIEAMVPR